MHVKETPNGIHIEKAAMDNIEDEADEIEDEFKKLEKSHWAPKYEKA